MNTEWMSNKQLYREEAFELLADLEAALLELEESPGESELIGRIFRSLHTIKGSGSMFGFDEISAFAHEIETFFETVRNGETTVSQELIDLTLAAKDHIRAMLGIRDGEKYPLSGELQEIISLFRNLTAGPKGNDGEETCATREGIGACAEQQAGDCAGRNTYRIRFKPQPDIFRRGTNPILLLEQLCFFGEHKVTAYTDEIPTLTHLDPELCHTYWDILLTTSETIDAIKDVFIFIEDECELEIELIDSESSDLVRDYKRIGEILVEKGDAAPEDIDKALANRKRIGELLVEKGTVTRGKVESAFVEQQHVQKIRDKRNLIESTSNIRVASSKLDDLVNLVGELVTVQARLSQTAISRKDPEIVSIAEEVERLTCDLRDKTMSIRMLPIGTSFNKFRRVVRDLARELGREAEMITEGADTELDKTIIEKLSDPLIHLIRNSIDHGIEPPEIREQLTKPRKGTIRLSAEHSGGNVLIRIADDGAGLNAAAIRKRAVEKGLIAAEAELPDDEIFSLIFTPGFSTASRITNVSGRGVGMDVVRKTIEELRGSIDISSRSNAGSSITLKLPLTLVIIEGLLVEVGGENFIFPLSVIEECIERRKDASEMNGSRITEVRGKAVPYISLREEFGIKSERISREQIVIAVVEGQRVGFVVDKVIGERQTVIKKLGGIFRNVKGVSGATILGDGRVALILDIQNLVDSAVDRRTSERVARV